MALGTPASLGSAVGTATASSVSMTTGSSIPAGSLVVVAVVICKDSSISVSSISDGTNSYTLAKSALWDVATFACVELWYKENASAVSSGATITATLSAGTFGAGNPPIIAAAYVTGALTASSLDKTAATQYGATTAPSSGSSGTLSQALEVAFGALGGYRSGGLPTITEGAGFTQIVEQTGGAGNWFLHVGYQKVSATTALNYQPTLSSSSTGAQSIIATFKDDGIAATARTNRMLTGVG